MQLDIKKMEEALRDARETAHQVEATKATQGYKAFEKFVALATAPERPSIKGTDDQVAYASSAIFKAGIAHCASFFTSLDLDIQMMEHQIQKAKEAQQDEFAEEEI